MAPCLAENGQDIALVEPRDHSCAGVWSPPQSDWVWRSSTEDLLKNLGGSGDVWGYGVQLCFLGCKPRNFWTDLKTFVMLTTLKMFVGFVMCGA